MVKKKKLTITKKQKNTSMTLIPMITLVIIAIIIFFITGIRSRTYCGNEKCDDEETCASCPQDCGSCPTTTTPKITTTTVLSNVTTTIPDRCDDTDGGLKYDIPGTVSGYYSNQPFSFTDYCRSDTVVEYYCYTGHFGHEYYNCLYVGKKCLNGACV